ncbi:MULTISPECIES: hypothetical protein [Rhizobium/Agrobacterium group]|uniref:hypothetical protein n=1 Tax=Rhizobium/Agrobacterium group TaxID=227290 RepID=UPI0022C83315|nr:MULTISPECIES: hypothetical protein [Rhizobium/Agrobacterium group]MCZ7486154.1 hypothetical protein [Rhizobium rhizogenes]MDO3445531.1 hypothetical protein [Agrobacterium sp. V1]
MSKANDVTLLRLGYFGKDFTDPAQVGHEGTVLVTSFRAATKPQRIKKEIW